MSKTNRYLRTKTRTKVLARKNNYKSKEKVRNNDNGFCDVCGMETDDNGFCDTPALCRLEGDLLKRMNFKSISNKLNETVFTLNHAFENLEKLPNVTRDENLKLIRQIKKLGNAVIKLGDSLIKRIDNETEKKNQ